MKIAIIGSGISGNAAAWALATSTRHDLTIYEKGSTIGGHSATVDVDYDGRRIPVDTGFIVFNELNYPNFHALLTLLGVRTQRSDMGFSLSSRGGAFEWAGREKNVIVGFLARKRNLISPRHFHMLYEMFRFNRQAIADRKADRLGRLSLHAYLDTHKFSQRFRRDYLLPMAAAIWSMPMARILDFPAASFVAFFDNHRLLHWTRPSWRTISGGSREYVAELITPFRDRIRLNCGVTRVIRHDLGVDVADSSGRHERFDHVIIAAHSDQALAMLDEPTPLERSALSAIAYRDNDVYLHRDPRLMPKRRAAWAAWNVIDTGEPGASPSVTYWMNALQNIDPSRPLFVSLNPPVEPEPSLVFGRYVYAHPQYDSAAVAAQQKLGAIQGHGGVWYCGAWTGYGFHEDGCSSGLAVAERLGARVPWRGATSAPALAIAAE
ncbi:NAD(P)/FAD-dependent oxidoreductase [Terrarubrum flagellatum]|uniref:NAD(P)/FAD-dependent oxidoreductase n=1 Tax=Terrirubrum flagellatum TaxID=2895980 RepID=UPI0031456BC0